ncbi:MAG TPA: hypothetical protein VJZ91_03040 [Blastocatellia bacterium]|nr:hypothetical protein [Blastocatellia bacterium]
MMRIRIAIVFTLVLGLLAGTSRAARGDEKARAEELLAQARAALGGEAKLKAVQSLTASGQLRQVIGTDDGQEQVQGDIQFDLLLPDKYKRTETTSMGDGMAEITRVSGINGEQAFLDAHASGGGGMVIVRPGPSDPRSVATQTRALRREFARQLLSWLLVTPATLPLEYSYAGEAETKDGKADAIDVKGPEDFTARLFLDKQTHRPLLLSYRGPQPRTGMVRRQMGSSEEAEQRRKEVESQAARQADQPPPLADIEIYFADYSAEDGILLPHRITRAVNGQFSEEWELKKFKINPPLKPDQFKK